jgi:hypothetical protein
MNIKEINTAIMHGNLTNEELNSINDAIRFARAQLIARNKMMLSVGSNVKFTSSSRGTLIGTVEKINRKFVIVRETGKAFGNWKVPANMLEVV